MLKKLLPDCTCIFMKNLSFTVCCNSARKRRQVLCDFLVGAKCFSSVRGSISAQNAVIISSAATKHTATMFFLHGLGDTGHGWATFMQQIQVPHIKYVCPHAPVRPVTLNMGMIMPSWFDKKSLRFGINAEDDEPGIKAAAEKVHEWLDEEIRSGILSDRIVLGGFSQGGALALYSTFTFDKPLAGVVALSSYLPLHRQFPGERKENLKIPIFQGHGSSDPVVPHAAGAFAAHYIKAFNPNHTFKTYRGMPHCACDEEIDDMERFLAERLPKNV